MFRFFSTWGQRGFEPEHNDLALPHVRALNGINTMQSGPPETMVSNCLSTCFQLLRAMFDARFLACPFGPGSFLSLTENASAMP